MLVVPAIKGTARRPQPPAVVPPPPGPGNMASPKAAEAATKALSFTPINIMQKNALGKLKGRVGAQVAERYPDWSADRIKQRADQRTYSEMNRRFGGQTKNQGPGGNSANAKKKMSIPKPPVSDREEGRGGRLKRRIMY